MVVLHLPTQFTPSIDLIIIQNTIIILRSDEENERRDFFEIK